MEKKKSLTDPIDVYAVQCGKCKKWRVIEDKEEYETIRERFSEDPWFCEKKPNVSCDDPGDMEYDTSRVWVMDRPNIPKTPPNTKRSLNLRKDFSKFDVYYVMPNNKKIRSLRDAQNFLKTYPEYKDQFSLSDFNFSTPKILEEMMPRKVAKGKNDSPGSNKKMKVDED